MNKKLQEEARRDFMLENINEVLLVDPRAKRLLVFIIKKMGLSKALKDPRIESFVMSLTEGDEPDYDILTEMVMQLKGYNIKPLDYLANRKDRIFTKDEIYDIFPYIKRFENDLKMRCKTSYLCGDGFIIKIEEEYFKIYNAKEDRLFEPIYVIR